MLGRYHFHGANSVHESGTGRPYKNCVLGQYHFHGANSLHGSGTTTVPIEAKYFMWLTFYGMSMSVYLRVDPHGHSDGRSGTWLRTHSSDRTSVALTGLRGFSIFEII